MSLYAQLFAEALVMFASLCRPPIHGQMSNLPAIPASSTLMEHDGHALGPSPFKSTHPEGMSGVYKEVSVMPAAVNCRDCLSASLSTSRICSP